jgi:hypothetical protein
VHLASRGLEVRVGLHLLERSLVKALGYASPHGVRKSDGVGRSWDRFPISNVRRQRMSELLPFIQLHSLLRTEEYLSSLPFSLHLSFIRIQHRIHPASIKGDRPHSRDVVKPRHQSIHLRILLCFVHSQINSIQLLLLLGHLSKVQFVLMIDRCLISQRISVQLLLIHFFKLCHPGLFIQLMLSLHYAIYNHFLIVPLFFQLLLIRLC